LNVSNSLIDLKGAIRLECGSDPHAESGQLHLQ
jgi:hypothetical protein